MRTNLPEVRNVGWMVEHAPDSRSLLRGLADKIDEAFAKASNKNDWLGDAEGALGIGGLVEERSALFRGVILYKVREKWDELPLSDKSFIQWATQITKRDASTINNWARVAEVFVLLPPQDIPEDFNPETIPHSNLVVASRAVSDGELSQEDWEVLKDPNTPHRELVERLHGPREDRKPKLPANNHYYKREGHMVLFVDGTGEILEFLEFSLDFANNPDDPRYRSMVAVLEFLRVK